MNKFTTIFVTLLLFVSVAFPQQWTKNSNISEGSYTSVSFKNNSDTGLFASKAGDVFATNNGGTSFYAITPTPKNLLNAISINGTNVWAVGASKTLRSTDWGAMWIDFGMFNPISMSNVTDVTSVGDSTWFVGIDTAYSHVVRLTHVGNTYGWRSSQFPLSTPVQKADYLLGRIWAYGQNDTVYNSTVNEPWVKNQIDPTVLCVVSMFVDTNNTLFALTQNSDNSGLYKSLDTGKTWSKVFVQGKAYAGVTTQNQIFISVLDGIPKILLWVYNSWQNSFQPDSVISNFASIQNNVWAVGASGVYQYKLRTTNNPPISQTRGKKITITAGKTLTDTLRATDTDGDPLKYHQYLTNLSWVHVDSISGVRYFHPQLSDTGTHLPLFRVYDEYGGEDKFQDTVVVIKNRPPVIENWDGNPPSINFGDRYKTALVVHDLDRDTCLWQINQKPNTMTSYISHDTLYLDWIADTVGVSTINVTVNDQHGGSDTWYRELTVTRQINPLVIRDITDTVGYLHQIYNSRATLIFKGTGKVNFKFILNQHHPNFLSINSDSGFITGTPNQTGRYTVIVQAIDEVGTTDQTQYSLFIQGPNGFDNNSEVPTEFALHQNYPNPFNPTTTISFSLPISSMVKLTVYNNLGQEIAVLMDQENPIGNFSVQWNPEGLPSGIYTYRLVAGSYVETKKMLLLK